jgi:hypothetical protein
MWFIFFPSLVYLCKHDLEQGDAPLDVYPEIVVGCGDLAQAAMEVCLQGVGEGPTRLQRVLVEAVFKSGGTGPDYLKTDQEPISTYRVDFKPIRYGRVPTWI